MYFPSANIPAIVQPLGGRQLRLLAARRRNRVDIESPFLSPTNASVFPSGDQPCQYEGDF